MASGAVTMWGLCAACLVTMATVAGAQLSPECASQVEAVARAVRRLEPRAVAMADAWAKPAAGVLSGNTRLLGDFDECVAAGGRLCVAEVVPSVEGGGGSEDPEARLLAKATAGRAHLETTGRQATFLMMRFSQWQWAACVPATCSAADARQMVLASLRPPPHSRLRLNVTLQEEDCSDGQPAPWDLPAAIALGCVAALFAVSVAASAFLEIRRRRGKEAEAQPEGSPPAWASLSVQSGWRQLWTLRAPAGSVDSLEALRVFSTLWVVALHKMIVWVQQPAANKAVAAEFAEDMVVTPIVNGISSVDTFLLISGFLRCRNMLRELDEGRFSYWWSLLQRLIRLVPAYAAMVVLYATLLPRAGSGPLWQQTIGPQVDWCRRNWHLNLLFVNNYVGTEEICMAQSWYLSADMQLFVAAPLLVWPLHRWRRAGPTLLTSLLVVSVALPAATLLLLCDCPALIGLTTSDAAALRYARYIYFPTHNRMAPYLVGMGLAYVIHRGYFTKISKTTSSACWVVSLLTLSAVVVGPRRMLVAGYRFDAALPESAAYAGLHAAAWAAAAAWLVFACHTRRAGWVGSLLEARLLRPWSRLCYAVYLTHLAVLLWQQGSMRVPPALDKVSFVHDLLGDLAISALVSCVLYLVVEAPCLGLGRALLRRLRPRPQHTEPRRPDSCVTAA